MSRSTSTTIAIEPRPGLAKCRPEKDARRKHRNEWFLKWCSRHGFTQRYIAENWGVAKSFVSDVFEARRSIQLDDLDAFPPLVATMLMAELMADIATRQAATTPVSAAHR